MTKPSAKNKASQMASLVASASNGGDKFKAAAQVLSTQPTGFHEAQPAPIQIAPASVSTETKDAQGRRVYYAEVDEKLCVHNPYSARRIYSVENVKQLAASMSATGQLEPGLATIRDGKYIIVAGNTRLKGIRLASIPTMKLMVHEDLTDRELFEYSFKENHDRTAQSAMDNALVWSDLLKNGLYPNEVAISDALGISPATINKTLSILNLPGTVLEIIREKPEDFALSALYELNQLVPYVSLQKAEELCKKMLAGEAGRRECIELRQSIQNPRKRKPKESSRQYKIHTADGEEIGVIKDWDSGRVALEITIQDESERMKLVDELKTRFKLND